MNTPAMVLKLVGVGSQYAGIYRDENHQYLDGGKCYSLTLPPNVPGQAPAPELTRNMIDILLISFDALPSNDSK